MMQINVTNNRTPPLSSASSYSSSNVSSSLLSSVSGAEYSSISFSSGKEQRKRRLLAENRANSMTSLPPISLSGRPVSKKIFPTIQSKTPREGVINYEISFDAPLSTSSNQKEPFVNSEKIQDFNAYYQEYSQRMCEYRSFTERWKAQMLIKENVENIINFLQAKNLDGLIMKYKLQQKIIEVSARLNDASENGSFDDELGALGAIIATYQKNNLSIDPLKKLYDGIDKICLQQGGKKLEKSKINAFLLECQKEIRGKQVENSLASLDKSLIYDPQVIAEKIENKLHQLIQKQAYTFSHFYNQVFEIAKIDPAELEEGGLKTSFFADYKKKPLTEGLAEKAAFVFLLSHFTKENRTFSHGNNLQEVLFTIRDYAIETGKEWPGYLRSDEGDLLLGAANPNAIESIIKIANKRNQSIIEVAQTPAGQAILNSTLLSNSLNNNLLALPPERG